jgi:hypothetical protein
LPPRFAVSQKTAGKSNSNPAHGQHLAVLNNLICVLAFRLHIVLVRGARSAPIGGRTKLAPCWRLPPRFAVKVKTATVKTAATPTP